MSLEASDLRFSYPGGEELFDGLSLAVSPGERVAAVSSVMEVLAFRQAWG